MSTTGITPSLEQQIQELQRRMREQVPPEILDVFAASAAELARLPLSDAVGVGARAPDFELPNAAARTVRLADLLAAGPVALAFYRGEWCPYCNLQLRAYQAILPQIEDLGGTLVAISPQTPDHSLSMAEKNELGFEVLSDEGNAVARRYGLVFSLEDAIRETYRAGGMDIPAFNGDESWELPVPATYVLGEDGLVALAFVEGDYRRRLEPAAIIEAFGRLRATPGSAATGT